MTDPSPVPASGSMPETPGARLDAARATLAALEDEGRRLQRLGLELPLARCHQQARFWRFATAMLSLDGGAALPGGRAWPAARR